jgi:leucyl-tRNA synthetase
VQINGKTKKIITTSLANDKSKVEQLVRQDKKLEKLLGKRDFNIIFIPNKLINFVG